MQANFPSSLDHCEGATVHLHIQWEKAWEISSHAVMSCNIRMQSHKGQYSIITVYIYLGLCMLTSFEYTKVDA